MNCDKRNESVPEEYEDISEVLQCIYIKSEEKIPDLYFYIVNVKDIKGWPDNV